MPAIMNQYDPYLDPMWGGTTARPRVQAQRPALPTGGIPAVQQPTKPKVPTVSTTAVVPAVPTLPTVSTQVQTPTVQAQSPSTGFSGLVPNTPSTGQVPFTQAPMPSGVGGNYSQVQNSLQGGQFATQGQSTEQQTGTTSQNQKQTTEETGKQSSTGTVTSTPTDTLGFGELLKGQAGQVTADDAARSAFLRDTMENGGSGFQSQLDKGIRSSLTGPQMTGAGDSARARAAGYAAADVGRNNLNQRLAASEQLTNPGGFSSLVGASTPFMGKSETSTGESLTSQLNKMSGSTTGFSDMLTKGAEAQAGATTAQSSQAGAGNIPQGQPVKAGGCVLCTAAIELKLSKHHHVLRRVIKHKLKTDAKRFHNSAKGYFAVFTPFAAWLLSHPRLARVLWPMAKAVVYEELRVSGRRLPFRAWASLVHWTGHTFCAAVGAMLPVKGYVDDIRILEIAKREGILFTLEGSK